MIDNRIMNSAYWFENSEGEFVSSSRQNFIGLDLSKYSLKVNKSFMENVDWMREPHVSFDKICAIRAQQLRDQHRRIILYYSGGPDSYHVYRTFKDNNIPLDEIIFYRYVDATDNLGYDFLKKEKIDDITVVNLDYNTLTKILEKDLWAEENYNFNGSIHNFARFRIDFYERLGLLPKQNRPPDSCHLFCGIYPTIRVRFVDDKVLVKSRITANQLFLPSASRGNTQFYFSPDLPYLHIKQSHMLARYILRKTKPKSNEEMLNLVRNGLWTNESKQEKIESGLRTTSPYMGDSFKKNLGNIENLTLTGTESDEILKSYRYERNLMERLSYHKPESVRVSSEDLNNNITFTLNVFEDISKYYEYCGITDDS